METIYSIDYLKSISKEKLWSLAKKRTDFNAAFMERKLKMPKDSVRFAVKTSSSKYDKKIRKYLIDFLKSENNLITNDTESNLEELFLEANKYQLVTNVSIAKDLKCSVGTVSLCKTGKNKTKTYYKIKQYLENIIEQGKLLGAELPKDFNLEMLFEEANKYEKVTISKIAKDLDCHTSTISDNIHGKRKGQTAYKIKEYLENIIDEYDIFSEIRDGCRDYDKKEEIMNYTFDYLNTLSVPEIHNLTTAELWSFVRGIYGISLKELSEATKVPFNSICPSLADKDPQYSKYSQTLREYLLDFLDAKEDKEEYDIFSEIHKATQEEQKKEEIMATNYNINYLNNLTLTELFDLAKNKFGLTHATMERDLSIPAGVARYAIKAKNSKYEFDIKNYLVEFLLEKDLEKHQEIFDSLFKGANLTNKEVAEALGLSLNTVSMSRQGKIKDEAAYKIKEYLENIIKQYQQSMELENNYTYEFNLKQLFEKARKYQHLTIQRIAKDLNCSISAVYFSIQGKSTGKIAYKVKDYLKNIIEENESHDNIWGEIDKVAQEEEKEQETMTEETLTDTKEMKTYDEFLNFINTQKELPIVKKALDETLSEKQNLDKILAKEEFITIETAQELNEKLFANEYTEEEILDFENQYFGTTDNDSLKDKIKSFVEKHNLSLETALKLLQISEEDYKKMLEGADKVSNKTADKIYKAISAFDEFYRSEKTQNTINNTKNTFVTGVAIASAKGQTFLNKGLNKFADFLNKSADKIKNSNSENKED